MLKRAARDGYNVDESASEKLYMAFVAPGFRISVLIPFYIHTLMTI